ncbi:nucleotide exchange factor GrpE [Cryptosporangium arvum]|uniref:nucleotide exchange factor GrpE n=1 Tax=Cryptosporangium arvum TaxID=80871 RepID=UPI0004B748C4|nr:nucleotide exchange factor GrpE [Cryptosporangium arvum]
MPTSFVRLIVAGLTLVLAVLTGLVTGMAAGGDGSDCGEGQTPASTVSSAPANGPSTGPTTAGGGPVGDASPSDDGGKPNVDVPGGTPPEDGGLPGVNEALTLNDDGCGNQAIDPLTALFGFLGALLAGGIVAGIALFVPRTDTPAAAAAQPVSSGAYGGYSPPVPQPVSSGHSTGSHAVLTDAPPETGRLTRDRKTLVETAIYVRDRATSKAIADRLAWALNEVGVVEDRPAGEAFDTARHEAGGTTPTTDPALSGTIAAVEISGYTDRGQIVRAPVVTVYQSEAR